MIKRRLLQTNLIRALVIYKYVYRNTYASRDWPTHMHKSCSHTYIPCNHTIQFHLTVLTGCYHRDTVSVLSHIILIHLSDGHGHQSAVPLHHEAWFVHPARQSTVQPTDSSATRVPRELLPFRHAKLLRATKCSEDCKDTNNDFYNKRQRFLFSSCSNKNKTNGNRSCLTTTTTGRN